MDLIQVGLALIGIAAAILLIFYICTLLSDLYQCWRFNKRICRLCNTTFRRFKDVYAQDCIGFHCATCGYTTYVTFGNPFINPELLKD